MTGHSHYRRWSGRLCRSHQSCSVGLQGDLRGGKRNFGRHLSQCGVYSFQGKHVEAWHCLSWQSCPHSITLSCHMHFRRIPNLCSCMDVNGPFDLIRVFLAMSRLRVMNAYQLTTCGSSGADMMSKHIQDICILQIKHPLPREGSPAWGLWVAQA